FDRQQHRRRWTPGWSHHWRKGGPMLLAKLTSQRSHAAGGRQALARGCSAMGRVMPPALPFLPAGVESGAMRMVAAGEALSESGDDFLSAPRDSMFFANVVAAFRSGGADVDNIDDVVSLGVYLTVAVKAPKLTATIS